MVLELCFSCNEGASSQMDDCMGKLLVVTLHDAISSPNLTKRLSWMPRTCLAKNVGVPRTVVLSTSRSSHCLSKR